MSKILTFTATILMITLCASLLGTATAQTYNAGVSVGDVYKYKFNFNADINGSEQTFMPDVIKVLVEQTKTIDWIQMTITNVSGTNIEAETLTQLKTGHQQTYTGTVDVATGKGELALFFIASNLQVNDPIRVDSSHIINGTTTRTYGNETRELNYEKLVIESDVPLDELAKYNISVPLKQVNTQESYWDKQTGSIVEMSVNMVTESSQVNATMTVSINLVESSVFTVPEYPTVLIVLMLLIVPTLVIFKKRKNF